MVDERTFLIAAAAVILAVLGLAYLTPKLAVRKALGDGGELSTAEQLTAENDRRKTIFEVAGAILLVIGVTLAYLQLQNTRDQLNINDKAQLTDRLVKTVQQIGSEKQTEQIGGMYGLRSVTVDALSKGDTSYLEMLDQTLSAFIRQHAPWPCPQCAPGPNPRPKDAVQVALYVLGDRERTFGARLDESRTSRIVNLRDVDLRNADLTALNLNHVDFRGSNLSFADVTEAHLDASDLSRTILDRLLGRHKVHGTGTKWA